MELKIIKNKRQYEEYLNWVDVQFDKKLKANTPQGEKLQVALVSIFQGDTLSLHVYVRAI